MGVVSKPNSSKTPSGPVDLFAMASGNKGVVPVTEEHIGKEIHYTGHQLNPEKTGKITKLEGGWAHIEYDDGTKSKIPSSNGMSYPTGENIRHGSRWFLKEDYSKVRKEELDRMIIRSYT